MLVPGERFAYPRSDRPTIEEGADGDMSTADDTTKRASALGRLVALMAALALIAAACGGDDTDAGGAESGAGDTPADAAASDPSGISNLAFTTESGDEADLSDFYGEPLVVNFFASWCAPCRAELPDFEAVHLAVEDEVTFLGVSHDIDEGSWRGLVDETGITFETVFQPNQDIWETLGLFGMPSTIFISAEGELVHRFTGPLDDEALIDLIAEHLSVEA